MKWMDGKREKEFNANYKKETKHEVFQRGICVHVLYIAQYMANFMLGISQYCIFQCSVNPFFLSLFFFFLPW